MAAGLSVSWFHSLDEDFVVVRVSADDRRLHIEAERIELNMREAIDFSAGVSLHRPPMECFNPYRKGQDDWYETAFVIRLLVSVITSCGASQVYERVCHERGCCRVPLLFSGTSSPGT